MQKFWVVPISAGLVAAFAAWGCSQEGPAGRSAQEAVGSSSPATGKAYGAIDGKHLWKYVVEQADISRRYRDQGHPQYWGRITGTSGDAESAQWLLEKFRQIGLADVHSQPVALFNPQWAPESWEVTATTGAQTMKLESATPTYGAVSTDGKVLDVPVAYVGLGSEADFAERDIRGKAVLHIRGFVYYRLASEGVLKRAEDQGATAFFGSGLRGGNYKTIDYRKSATIPTFKLGTEDALAVRDMISNAPANNPPHLKIRLDAKWVTGQKSALVWGTLPGSTDETIYVIAHRDGYFDAAGDNASGVAVMLGIAEHFAKVPQSQRRRTMIFVGIDGHHNVGGPGGAFGKEWLFANREKFFSKTALLINCEHPSELATHRRRGHGGLGHRGMMEPTDQVKPMWWYAGGPSRPQLTEIVVEAFHEFGVPRWAEQLPFEQITGDLNPFARIVPAVIAQASYFYHMHTDADSPDIVPPQGLEAVTRAYARIIDEVNKLPLKVLQRPPELESYSPRLDLTDCAAWIADSSVPCKPKN